MMRFDGGGGRAAGDWSARRDGGAYVVEVCRKTEFSFSFIGTTPASFAPLVHAVPAFDWTSGLLVVRLHAVTWVNSTITVEVHNVSVTPDDPSIIFGTGATGTLTPPAAIGSVQFTGAVGPTAPALNVAGLGSTIGPMLEVGIRTLGVASGTVRLTLSIELIGRNG